MASGAAFDLQRSMLKNEWALLIGVAFNAARIGTDSQFRLFCLEPAMRVVTIAALHCAFKHLVVEWLRELRLGLVVAAHAKLGLAGLEHGDCRIVRDLL